MDPVTLTTERLLLRTPGPQDTDAVHAACQDPDIRRWTTIPSPYLREHSEGFVGQMVPDGWRHDSMFTFGVFEPLDGTLLAMVGITRRAPGTAEIGFWATKAHRRRGHVTEAVLACSRWAFTEADVDRMEWQAEVGNAASRAVAVNAGFTLEGIRRSALLNKGTRRDGWTGSLLPSDLGLPTKAPYLPGPQH